MSEFTFARGDLEFRKSAFSKSDSFCVEVAETPDGGKAVRDSEDPDGPVLLFSAGAWDAFKKGMRAGEFD